MAQVAQDAVEDARAVCFREYGSAPQVVYHGSPGLQLAYVPSHLHHMLFELVKNSLRAVQDRFDASDSDPPPIHVVIAEGQEDITIKVRLWGCPRDRWSWGCKGWWERRLAHRGC